MEFLKYLWRNSIRDTAIGVTVFLVIGVPMFLVIWNMPRPWLEAFRAACFTSCLFGVPIIMVLSVYGWLRQHWIQYQQYKRWKAGDHSA